MAEINITRKVETEVLTGQIESHHQHANRQTPLASPNTIENIYQSGKMLHHIYNCWYNKLKQFSQHKQLVSLEKH